MKAFFAVGDASTAARMLIGRRVLFSFAYIGSSWLPEKHMKPLCAGASDIMVDSGAFTVWNRGEAIDIGRYVAWLLSRTMPYSTAISLDVIGDADSSVKIGNALQPKCLIPVSCPCGTKETL